jgi:hypothetical protein
LPFDACDLLSLVELPPELPVLLDEIAPVVVVAFCVVCAELSKFGAIVLPLAFDADETPACELLVFTFVAVEVVSSCPASCVLIVQFVEPAGQVGTVCADAAETMADEAISAVRRAMVRIGFSLV